MKAGTLLYVYNYIFENGESKNKYFLVIKNIDENNSVLISLPSSQDYIPSHITDYGCIELPGACQNAFVFKENEIITNTNFKFPKKTFLYGGYLRTESINDLKLKYPVEGIHFENKGILKKRYLESIIQCYKNSSTVLRKYKKLL